MAETTLDAKENSGFNTRSIMEITYMARAAVPVAETDGFINRTLSFRPENFKLLGTLAELDDRSMSAVARRLIEAEGRARKAEIEEMKCTQGRGKKERPAA
jgi:hypothetical protein